jgi:hypothetical protein
MDRNIAQLNIEHLRRQLSEEADEVKRMTLANLLAEEEEKFAAIAKRQQETKKTS